MRYTKIYATEEEKRECQELADTAGRTPVIALSSADALSGNDFSSRAWKRVNETVYKYALAHGLPEIEGYYGMTQEGEFVEA